MQAEFIGSVIVNCATTSGGKTVTPSSMTGIAAGQAVTGTGIPAGAYVKNVYASTVEISAAATATNAATALSFNNKPVVLDGFTVGHDKADYGSDWSGYAAPTPKNANLEIRVARNTNGSGSRRVYIYANGEWIQATFTVVS